ncbi:single-stranded DNA-binding protein [Candidatus Dependentiae bacterium]|nr:single-stranded DNA-binding protein [Candidatus Dependentiae bacterium]
MASYNRVIIMGNLTRDPEHKQLASGQAVCRLGLASNRQFKNRQTGAMVQEVCFVDIDVWGPQADSCSQYLQKGRAVLVEGRLKLDTWVDNDGQRRSKHSVVADRVTFMPTAAAQEGFESQSEPMVDQQPSAQVFQGQKETAEKKAAPAGEVDFNDQKPFEDDLPF